MKRCIYCDAEFLDERPFAHCTRRECVDTWMIERRSHMSIALIPKVGFQPVFTKDMRHVSGRSSGR